MFKEGFFIVSIFIDNILDEKFQRFEISFEGEGRYKLKKWIFLFYLFHVYFCLKKIYRLFLSRSRVYGSLVILINELKLNEATSKYFDQQRGALHAIHWLK